MEISAIPPNIYHRLALISGSLIEVGKPLPGGGDDAPKVWLIVFTPTKTDSTLLPGDEEEGESEGESRWTVPAKYHVLMREHDGRLAEDVQIHEIWADKVLVSTRLTQRAAAIEEFTALIREELGEDAPVDLDLKDLAPKASNGQQTTATT